MRIKFPAECLWQSACARLISGLMTSIKSEQALKPDHPEVVKASRAFLSRLPSGHLLLITFIALRALSCRIHQSPWRESLYTNASSHTTILSSWEIYRSSGKWKIVCVKLTQLLRQTCYSRSTLVHRVCQTFFKFNTSKIVLIK